MNAALRTKLLAVVLLAGITGGTVATINATTAPEQGSTPSALRGGNGSGLFPGYVEALEDHLGGTVMDEYGRYTVRDFGERLCIDAERGATDTQIITAASQGLGGMGSETARRLYAIVLAYGICSIP
ncbi:hypothetical protein CH298_27010 [Rhodococcoides fascians]|uniref:hypothetical protein n=1 Tax=Rhodococcoides fascians TaxID=1828 RepID=UPI000B9AD25B|nr:hypothetical protein [Rhodococcus fascians]OZE81408.1 hypothetical protein CH303_27550 [Rhodococcus fascians]OZF10232.1 hypothetical protein CH298_27010 [Rhodococcus fascians]OZF13322.1 hypothetical protein CH297_27300 [Rhodococcus fascians]OZF59420.1 hypothetical protein CH308_27750 [Rhodococcus fascians]OZF60535.1 hypothetical protein CH307_27935 [Rhodococcus fascians]